MNLLFYQGVRRKTFPPIRSGRSQRRATFGISDAKIFILFFRYFSPDAFIRYIRACGRAAPSDISYLQNFFRITGNLWSTRIFHSFDAITRFVNIMNASAGGTILSDIINASFGWADTPEGGDYWRDHHRLFGQFCAFLQNNRIDTNAFSLHDLDVNVYPMLRADRILGFNTVNSLPTESEPDEIHSQESDVITAANTGWRPRRQRILTDERDAVDQSASTIESNPEPTSFEVRDFRIDAESNTYSYIDDRGVTIRFSMPGGNGSSGSSTTTFITPDGFR